MSTKTQKHLNYFGWSKDYSQRQRRDVVLKRCHGNLLVAGQALLNLYKKSRDPETRQKARADALYFFELCKKDGRKNGTHKR